MVSGGSQSSNRETLSRGLEPWGAPGLGPAGGACRERIGLKSASLISYAATDLAGATELLAFDDASALLAVRTVEGGVRVHDVDANFAAIHTLDGVTGPVAIDGSRDLLVTISPDEAMLKLIASCRGCCSMNGRTNSWPV